MIRWMDPWSHRYSVFTQTQFCSVCLCFRAWLWPHSGRCRCPAPVSVPSPPSPSSPILSPKTPPAETQPTESELMSTMLSGSYSRSTVDSPAMPSASTRARTTSVDSVSSSVSVPTVCGVPSGTVVLEAQYDYQYRGADGRQVCIREGERFILLRKTNTDWWQVRRSWPCGSVSIDYGPSVTSTIWNRVS